MRENDSPQNIKEVAAGQLWRCEASDMKGTHTWKQGAKKTNVIASETISKSTVGCDASQPSSPV